MSEQFRSPLEKRKGGQWGEIGVTSNGLFNTKYIGIISKWILHARVHDICPFPGALAPSVANNRLLPHYATGADS